MLSLPLASADSLLGEGEIGVEFWCVFDRIFFFLKKVVDATRRMPSLFVNVRAPRLSLALPSAVYRFPALDKMKSQLSELLEGRGSHEATTMRALRAKFVELGFVWPDKVLELVKEVYASLNPEPAARYNWLAAVRATW